MSDTRRDDLISWLRDAHAMEAATIDNLQRLIEAADDYPRLKAQAQRHRQASIRQRDEIERELGQLGSDPSTLKDVAMKLPGNMEPLLSLFTPDSMPKNCIAGQAWEHFEIASYRSMLGAAEELGMAELRAMCERFIAEEKAMADFFYEHLPEVTRQYPRGRAS